MNALCLCRSSGQNVQAWGTQDTTVPTEQDVFPPPHQQQTQQSQEGNLPHLAWHSLAAVTWDSGGDLWNCVSGGGEEDEEDIDDCGDEDNGDDDDGKYDSSEN